MAKYFNRSTSQIYKEFMKDINEDQFMNTKDMIHDSLKLFLISSWFGWNKVSFKLIH